ncbi:spermidine/putrescine ABC transporter substrate-binding protein [Bacillus sp. RG28]|uniref:Spermidine/putrescine ABC transporter substrate-binding protein n=1 Tax=Gottfriedia endophytica TaxID=2820819 RepID=A0A940NM23_9BACI|nr:spermidine/putrescine ABC transporter substrate-binding protein [Gottfriedia endophytica]MBP0724664.1 spermidine/putrescine ABC transporter substrate-binding protein [Gottfriedia endophytica]
MKIQKKLLVLCIMMCLGILLLTSCSSSKPELNIYSWADNFDESVLQDFEKKYNVKVNYQVFASNEELYAKLKAGGSKYDVIQPSDYMVKLMIKQNMLEKLNKAKIPNLSNIAPQYTNEEFDPKGDYSVVYTGGVTGIAYNPKYVKGPITSWNDLWNPKYKGHVTLLDDSREVLGMGLIKNGFSNSTKNENEINIAYNNLKTLVPNLLAFDTDNVKQKFITEDAWIGQVWSGDAAFIQLESPDIKWAVPKEGATRWADTLAIPKDAQNKELAEKFINYLYEPKVSAINYESIGYTDPNTKSYPYHSKSYLNNSLINLSVKDMKNLQWISDVGKENSLYDKYWTKLKTGQE